MLFRTASGKCPGGDLTLRKRVPQEWMLKCLRAHEGRLAGSTDSRRISRSIPWGIADGVKSSEEVRAPRREAIKKLQGRPDRASWGARL